jgi:uncharacterized membrane protein (DUF485 family)
MAGKIDLKGWLPKLYPPEWRARYEDEFSAMLQARRMTVSDVFDTVAGAVDARLFPQVLIGRLWQMLKSRRMVLAVFLAYVGFIVAGLGFYGMVDDSPFVPAMSTHLELASAWIIIEVGSVIALGAAAVGGLPIFVAVLKHALREARRDLFLLAVPVVVLGLLLLWVAVAVASAAGWLPWPVSGGVVAPGEPLPLGNLVMIWVAIAIVVVGAAASAVSISLAVLRANVGPQTFRMRGLTVTVEPFSFASLPALVTTAAMGLMLVGMVAWGLSARASAPQAFSDNLVPWLIYLGMMVLSTAAAAIAVKWGYRGATVEVSQLA